MKKLISFFFILLFFTSSAFADNSSSSLLDSLRNYNQSASTSSTVRQYREIVDYIDELLPIFGFSDRDFLGGSTTTGLMSYSYENNDFRYNIFFDAETYEFKKFSLQCSFADVHKYLYSIDASVQIGSFISGADVGLMADDFNNIIHAMYYFDDSLFYNGYRFDICFQPFNPFKFDLLIRPDDGTYKKKPIVYQSGWTYDQLARYPEYYIGERFSVNGKIEHITGSSEYGYSILLSVSGNKLFYAHLNPPYLPDYKLLVGDKVTFKSIFAGDYTYNNVYGVSTSLPLLNVEEVKLRK